MSLLLAPVMYADSTFWTTPDPGLPPTIPGNRGGQTVYITGPGTHAIYGSPDGTVDLSNVMHDKFRDITRMTAGPNEMDSFDSSLSGMVSIGGGPEIPFELNGPVMTTELDKAGQTTGTFSTIMDSMDLTGTVDGHSIEVMLDPTRPTTGQTTITEVSPGLYHINSFFDVFTELSIDHHAFFPQIGGPSVVTLTCIPEPAALVPTLLGLGGLSALAAIRRRRTT